jgi:hypothetical protein
MVQLVAGYCAVIAIAGIYYVWRDGYCARARRRAELGDRVAFMLWTAANRTR